MECRWRCLLLALALLVLPYTASGFQMGAPDSACESMTPAHGFPAQKGRLPYTVTVSNHTLKQGRRMMVTISRGDEQPFKGFFVQARRVADSEAPSVGRFYTKQHSAVSCGASQDNAITHSDNKEKEAVTLLWESPTDLDEEIAFRVSVLQNYQTFWVNYDSKKVRVSASGQELPSPEEESEEAPKKVEVTTEEPEEEEEIHDMTDALVRRRRPGRRRGRITTTEATTTTPPPTTTPSCGDDCEPTTAANTAVRSGIAAIYDTCLLAKGCFPLQDGCIQGRSCNLMVTYQRQPGGAYRFQLFGLYNPGNYIALGLSRDNRMGDDAVIYCVNRLDGGFQVLHAYNFGREAVPVRAASRVGPLMSDISGEFRDGRLLCEFTHSQRFTIQGEEFNLATDDLYLMVASGTASVDFERRPQYHNGARRATGAPVQLHLAAGVAGDSGVLFKIHGVLMLVAWLCFASIGMLVARYYKTTWPGKKLAGLDAWFHAHRTLMVLVVVMSVLALVLMLYQLGGWSGIPLYGDKSANPHPVIGILSIAFAVVQPFMAMCRCHPTASRRPVFNWLHWLVGTLAHLLAVIAIFFSVALPAAQLPFWTYWVLAIFVVFHIIVHLALSIQQCLSDRSARVKISSEAYSMRDMGSNGYLGHRDASDDGVGLVARKVLLGIYIIINLVLVALLVCMVVFAPAESWGITRQIRSRVGRFF